MAGTTLAINPIHKTAVYRVATLSAGTQEGHPLSDALQALSARDLFILYGSLMRQLIARGLVRTANAPVGDYAEYLVAKAFSGELAPNSEKSWDVRSSTGRRIQVKARVLGGRPKVGERQLSPFRSYDFDDLVVVLFGPDYSVSRAVQMSVDRVRDLVRFRGHVNANILVASDHALSAPGVLDITKLIRRASSDC